jgi:hypothetical protein
MVLKEIQVLRALKVQQVHKDLWDHRVQQAPKELKGLIQEPKEQQVLKELKEPKGLKVPVQELKELRDQQGQQELKDLQEMLQELKDLQELKVR